MSIITLTTDLGLKDHYLGAVKGAIYSQCPDVNVVDISHNIPPFNIIEAAFVLKNCFHRFPKGSIHVLDINPKLEEETEFLVILYKEHYFIGTNNGTFSLIFEQEPEKIFEMDIQVSDQHESFPLGDRLIKAACHIANGGSLEFIGKPLKNLHQSIGYHPITQENILKGQIMYIDRYGNALSNIDQVSFDSLAKNRSYTIEVNGYEINRISRNYSDVIEGEKLAMFSSSRLLEIAIHNGSASDLLALRFGNAVIIEFYDS